MANKIERERRKQILHELRESGGEEFDNSLPIIRESFKKLFGYLDAELTKKDCDNTPALTKTFLLQFESANVENTKKWRANNGGCCDCDILANVEELF